MKRLNKKIMFIIPLTNIIFPIISVEDIIPWISTAAFIYLSYKKINEGTKVYKGIIGYILCNGIIILIYNILIKIVTNYLVKLLM